MREFAVVVVSGVAVGAVFALIGMGFSLIYQTSGMLNFAFGEYVMIGSLVGYSLITSLGVPVIPALVGVFVLGALLSLIIDGLIFRPIRTRNGERGALIASVGLLILMNQVGVVGWGTSQLIYSRQIVSGSTHVFGIVLSGASLVTFGVALCFVVLIHLFLKRTRWGIMMRASAGDPVMAELMGIRRAAALSLSALITGGLAGISGMLLGSEYFASYTLDNVAVLGLVAATLGGFGNVNGALLGGILVGLVDTLFSTYFAGAYSQAVCYGLLIVVLMVRPQGLLGKTMRVG